MGGCSIAWDGGVALDHVPDSGAVPRSNPQLYGHPCSRLIMTMLRIPGKRKRVWVCDASTPTLPLPERLEVKLSDYIGPCMSCMNITPGVRKGVTDWTD